MSSELGGAPRALFERALGRRRELGLPGADTTAYRLFHGAADGLEGLTVDVYDQWALASLYTEQVGEREERWLDELSALGFRGVYLKHRPKQANILSEDELRARTPERAVRGEDAPSSFEIREAGIPFEVRLGDGLSTGLFLDQRDNRLRLAGMAQGKRVLNLFAYTCGFGVVAARAGALSTTNLDVAIAALERGKANYLRAGLALDGARFLARDVLDALPKLARRGERFEIVVLDPPSYASTSRSSASKSKGKSRFNVEHDYGHLASLALELLTPGGTLLACTNHQRLSDRDLERALRGAAAGLGRPLTRLEFVGPPADFSTPPDRPAHLKSAWCTL